MPDDMTTRLSETRRQRSYELEMHRLIAAADPEWFEKYAAFIEATYTWPSVAGFRRGRRTPDSRRPVTDR